MFIQVIRAGASDPAAVKAALDEWVADLAPDAQGWLGTTAGVTADGRFIAVVRFESEEAASRNSHLPEQDKWWSQTATLLSEPTFLDSRQVLVDIVGDPDDAGFVQIIQGRGSNPERAAELMTQDSDVWAQFRPDILASVGAMHDDGEYTMAMYFTSEAEARAGEVKEPPPQLKAQMEEMNSFNVGEPAFYDLPEPWLYART